MFTRYFEKSGRGRRIREHIPLPYPYDTRRSLTGKRQRFSALWRALVPSATLQDSFLWEKAPWNDNTENRKCGGTSGHRALRFRIGMLSGNSGNRIQKEKQHWGW
jgi:hypothetical protein